MLNSTNSRKNVIALVILIFAVLAAVIFYYFFLVKMNNKVPTKGFFVEYRIDECFYS